MNEKMLSYSIVQYSPRPERFEFINVGVMVFDPRTKRIASKLSSDFARVRRFFDEANSSFLKLALHDFASRVSYEFSKEDSDSFSDGFNSKRVGIFQITPVMPVLGFDPEDAAKKLFSELVVAKAPRKKSQRIKTRLTSAFKDAGILPLLDRSPPIVRLERYGVSIRASYGYQNGVYNLIDTARFDEPESGLAEAGKRILEGKALAEMLENRLVVVGDFGEQPQSYVSTIREEFLKVGAKLFMLEEVNILAEEIRAAAH